MEPKVFVVVTRVLRAEIWFDLKMVSGMVWPGMRMTLVCGRMTISASASSRMTLPEMATDSPRYYREKEENMNRFARKDNSKEKKAYFVTSGKLEVEGFRRFDLFVLFLLLVVVIVSLANAVRVYVLGLVVDLELPEDEVLAVQTVLVEVVVEVQVELQLVALGVRIVGNELVLAVLAGFIGIRRGRAATLVTLTSIVHDVNDLQRPP